MHVAWYDPVSHVLGIDEQVYDLCMALGADGLPALAVVLGHELAHYYYDHKWAADFGNAFADLPVGKQLGRVSQKDQVRVETEADYFGGFYGALAGYDTFRVAPRILEAIYTAYRLETNLRGYPTLAERQAIATRSAEQLRALLPAFEAGTYLLALQQYDMATRLLDYVAQTFPSREILNNVGVARALAALDLFASTDAARHFLYPFALDAETRLPSERPRGDTWPAEPVEARRQRLLQEAHDAFDKARSRDPNYATAWINLASVSDLQGEHDLAMAFAAKGLKVAQSTGEANVIGQALVVRGIAAANNGLREQAQADFTAAQPYHAVLANRNLAALQSPDILPATSGREKIGTRLETIGGMAIDHFAVLRAPDVTISLPTRGAQHPPLTLSIKQREAGQGFLVESGERLIVLLITRPEYGGASGRGITMGDPVTRVYDQYGEPARTVAARQGTYHVYTQTRIMFYTDAYDTVRGWMLYGF
jgi:tetratricopeptide (TPR) repeat protein